MIFNRVLGQLLLAAAFQTINTQDWTGILKEISVDANQMVIVCDNLNNCPFNRDTFTPPSIIFNIEGNPNMIESKLAVLKYADEQKVLAKVTFFIIMVTPQNQEIFFKFITDYGIMHYKWYYVVISPEDTRSILQPLITESTRVALFLEDSIETIYKGGNKDVKIPGSVFVSDVVIAGGVAFRPVNFEGSNDGEVLLETLKETIFSNMEQQYKDFQGRHLIVTSFSNAPWVYETFWNSEDRDVNKGIDGNLLHLFAEQLNFTYSIVQPPDGQWGALKGNNSWSGMIGLLHERKVDISINEITISAGRLSAVDMSDFYYIDVIQIISQAPKIRVPFNLVTRPFTWPVWAGFLIAIIGVIPLLWLLIRSGTTFSGNLMDVYRSIVQQSGFYEPHQSMARIFYTFWLIFCFLMSSHYLGVLYLHLTVVTEEASINSIRDLVNSARDDGTQVLAVKGAYISELFLGPGEGAFGELSQFKTPDWEGKYSVPELLQNVLDDPIWVTYWGKVSIFFIVNKLGKWKFHPASKNYFPKNLAMGYQKGSPLTPALNRVLRDIRSTGIVSQWVKENLQQSIKDDGSGSGPRLVVLTLKHLVLGFLLLVGGLALATISFFVEVSISKLGN